MKALMDRRFVDLLFLEAPTTEMRDNPISHVTCNPHSVTYQNPTSEHLCLTWGCKSLLELEAQITLIKAELDDVLIDAKSRYASYRKRMLAR